MNPLESPDHPLHQLLSPYSRKLGIEPVELGDDHAVFKMDYDQSNTTVADLVHGGALLSLADCAITGAAWSGVTDPENYRGVTVELSFSFMNGAHSTGVTANATVTRRGSSLCFCDVELQSNEQAIIGRAQAVYKLTRLKSPTETMTGFFSGKTAAEQKQLLAELERGGAQIYRTLADQAESEDERKALTESAEREEHNARILDGITTDPS